VSTTYPSTEARRAGVVGAASATTESIGGIVVIILAILALVGVLPMVLAAVAGIVFGVDFIVEGAALAARRSAVAARSEQPLDQIDGGVTVELVGGLAAIVLGVLALIGVAPTVLMGALVITGGAGLILSIGVVGGVGGLGGSVPMPSASAAHLMAGIAAVVLGILALVRPEFTTVLSTVGLLVLGASLTLSGTAFSSAMLRLFSRA